MHFHAKPLSPRRLFQNGLTFLSFAHTVFGMIIPSQKLLKCQSILHPNNVGNFKKLRTHTQKNPFQNLQNSVHSNSILVFQPCQRQWFGYHSTPSTAFFHIYYTTPQCPSFPRSSSLLSFQLSVGSTNSGVYSVHQPKGDSSVGNNKTGYLNKRSEGRLRNVWQKRKCQTRDSYLEIYHADLTKAPTRVNLLTCQMRPVAEDRLCFDVVSYNRTYHFQAENDVDRDEWMSVLLNSKDRALNQAFHNEDNGTNNAADQSFMELQKTLVAFIRGLSGNDRCCDCGSQNGKIFGCIFACA